MRRAVEKRARVLVLVAAVLVGGLSPILWSGSSAAEVDLVAIVNTRNHVRSIAEADLRNIFLGRAKFWSAGTAIHPYARPPSTPAGIALFRVLRMAPARYNHHWQTLQLSGRGTEPREIPAAALAAAYVAADPGGLTVMTGAEARRLPAGVRAVPVR